jgi:transposase-like protein
MVEMAHDSMISTRSEGLTPKQLLVLRALVSGATITAAATTAGIHRATIYTWCRFHPEFTAALRTTRHQQAEAVEDRLHGLSDSALATVAELINSSQAPAAVRLRAALAVIHGLVQSDPHRQTPTKAQADFQDLIDAAIPHANEETSLDDVLRQNSTEFDTFEKIC